MIRKILPLAIALILIGAIVQLPGWDQGAERVPPDTAPRTQVTPRGDLPPGHPPIDDAGAGPADAPPSRPEPARSGAADDDSDLPLTPTGLGSVEEMEGARARLPDEESREAFEEAFRLTFTTHREARDFQRAKTIFQRLLKQNPASAECYRGLAYAEFNTTMSFPATIALYEKAVELRQDYGEAHYALAFMLGGSDPTRGAEHFKKALELGIEDERNLGQRFYAGID
jgi:tetratricopeptide (TPR) repeat protein